MAPKLAAILLVAGLATTAHARDDKQPAHSESEKAQPAKAQPAKASTGKKSMLSRKPKAQGDAHGAKHNSDNSPDAAHAKPTDNAHEPTTSEHAPAQAATHDEHADDASHAATSKAAASNTAATMPAAHAAPAAVATATTPPTAAQALAWLREGNARWVKDQATNPSSDHAQRELAAGGQHPFVSVLGCADSRVPLERLFDRGVGEIFAVRVAGNVAGESELGTIEYGVEHLNTPLLVVMGHTKCGAVAAAASGAQVHGKVAGLLAHVQPAVERAKATNPELSGDELVAQAVQENVWQQIATVLRESSGVRERVESGSLTIVGAVYDIASGEVQFFGSHPWQRELLAASKVASQSAQVASHNASAAPAAPATVAPNEPASTHAAETGAHEE
jgi:carbonic anhydrase